MGISESPEWQALAEHYEFEPRRDDRAPGRFGDRPPRDAGRFGFGLMAIILAGVLLLAPLPIARPARH